MGGCDLFKSVAEVIDDFCFFGLVVSLATELQEEECIGEE